MSEEQVPWFVIERSQALSILQLTNQPGIEIVSQRKQEDGVDLYVGLGGQTSPPTQMFVVPVRGTLSTAPPDWVQLTKSLFRAGHRFYLPTCAFVVNVRDNTMWYAWIAGPSAEANRASLQFHLEPTFHELDDHDAAWAIMWDWSDRSK